MNLNYREIQDLSQIQTLNATQLQSLEILAMDFSELRDYLENEYLENPMLEKKELSEPDREAIHDEWIRYESLDREVHPREAEPDPEDEEVGWKEIPDLKSESLEEYLLTQMDLRNMSKQELALCRYLIGCLDENGFFMEPTEEIATETGCRKEDVDKMISRLKALDPAGIFSANMQECLIAQLEARGQATAILKTVLQEYWEDLGKGNLGRISRGLGISTAEARKCLAIISKLNPHPLSGFGSERAHYIVPDMIFRRDEAGWTILVNDGFSRQYGVNEYYLSLLKDAHDLDLAQLLKNKHERVKFLMHSIEQRRNTMNFNAPVRAGRVPEA